MPSPRSKVGRLSSAYGSTGNLVSLGRSRQGPPPPPPRSVGQGAILRSSRPDSSVWSGRAAMATDRDVEEDRERDAERGLEDASEGMYNRDRDGGGDKGASRKRSWRRMGLLGAGVTVTVTVLGLSARAALLQPVRSGETDGSGWEIAPTAAAGGGGGEGGAGAGPWWKTAFGWRGGAGAGLPVHRDYIQYEDQAHPLVIQQQQKKQKKKRPHEDEVPRPFPSTSDPYCDAPHSYPPPLPKDHGLELQMVQMTIRHGDRSAIHQIPWSSPLPAPEESHFMCPPFSGHVAEAWEAIGRYKVVNTEGEEVERALAPGHPLALALMVEGASKGECFPGQLSEYGAAQHLRLGAAYGEAYGGLLKQQKGPAGSGSESGGMAADELYVRCTDYMRTQQSAAAFLLGLLPPGGGGWMAADGGITLLTNEDESAEVMQGIGLQASSNGKGGGETEKEGSCSRAVRLSKEQADAFTLRDDVKERLGDLFDSSIASTKITDLSDNLHSLICHNKPLPLPQATARSMESESDRHFCMRYLGGQGGHQATKLSIYPFLQELLDGFTRKVQGESPLLFALFSGHDTVIAPVLAALGAYDCDWPPYASHVVFELWQGQGQGRDASGKGAREEGEEGGGDHFVRVVFNGEVVTHLVTSCRDKPSRAGREFCSLSVFGKTVTDLLLPAHTLEEACAV